MKHLRAEKGRQLPPVDLLELRGELALRNFEARGSLIVDKSEMGDGRGGVSRLISCFVVGTAMVRLV